MHSKMMQHAACRRYGVYTHSALDRWFPIPTTLTAQGAGVDISDGSIKWLSLIPAQRGWTVGSYGTLDLEAGIVNDGLVENAEALGRALAEVRAQSGISFAHAALPEEAAFVFAMPVADVRDRDQVRNIIEFELEGRVPLRPGQAVFDYDVVEIHPDGTGADISVTVFPADVIHGYVEAFKQSGIELLSLELEARSIARAAVPVGSNEVILLADFGRARTGIAILKSQIPIFTTTVNVGGSIMTKLIVDKLSVSEEEAVYFKNEHGISLGGNEEVREAMIGTASALSEEIGRHYQYWDTRRNEEGRRATPVAQVLLAGGSSNLKGLPEYIASRVQAPTEQVSAWQNVCLFADYIPPINRYYSLGYATSIGLALRSV